MGRREPPSHKYEKKTKGFVYSPKGKQEAPISVNLGSTLIEIADYPRSDFFKTFNVERAYSVCTFTASSAVGIIARMRHICPVKV